MLTGETASGDGVQAELVVDALERFGAVRMCVTGRSMLPSIWSGDVRTIRRGSVGESCLGDVALVLRGARFFAHRVVAHDGVHLITRGEAVPQAEAQAASSADSPE